MNALLASIVLAASAGVSACAVSSSGSGAPAPAPAAPSATATAAAAAAEPASAEPKVGDRAPDFSLPADDGSTFTLSKADKPLVVIFYPRAFTGG